MPTRACNAEENEQTERIIITIKQGWEFHSKTTRRLRSGESWWCTRCCKFQVMLLFGRPFEFDCVYLINTVGSWSVFSINKYSQENKKNRFLPFCKNTSEFSHFLPRSFLSVVLEKNIRLFCVELVGRRALSFLFIFRLPASNNNKTSPLDEENFVHISPTDSSLGEWMALKNHHLPRITLHSLCLVQTCIPPAACVSRTNCTLP